MRMNMPRMKPIMKSGSSGKRRTVCRWAPGVLLALFLLMPPPVHASIFKGEALDTAADVLTWVVLIFAPVVGITAFLLVHILPEKIAEKKRHPQTKAIQCLCLLSLAFGGLLWPLAWLWAYTKPVLHKMAYGTDVMEELEHEKQEIEKTENEVDQLRRRVAELESKLGGQSATDGGKA
jgi:CBS domain containing-hemolysin-like protein